MMPRQYALPFIRPRDDGEASFIHAPSNAQAWTWLERMADWPQHRLALFGPEGCGKSHLLRIWAARHGATVLEGRELRFAAAPAALAVDDADLAPERDLLHLLNAMAELGRPVLLAARAAPARWPVQLPDLASRLRAMAAVEIGTADDALLRVLLARLLAARQLRVNEELQDWLHLRLPRSQAAMHKAAAALERLSLGAGATWPVVRAVVALCEAPAENDEDFAPASPETARLV
jgi:chromosomal replication initiation ATPase DnaA